MPPATPHTSARPQPQPAKIVNRLLLKTAAGVAVVGALLFGGAVSPANAAGGTFAVASVTPLTPTVTSGNPASFVINYTCAGAGTCDVAKLSLIAERSNWSYPATNSAPRISVSSGDAYFVTTGAATNPVLTAQGSIPAGTSGQITVTLDTPFAAYIPNGAEWKVSASGSANGSTASPIVSGIVTTTATNGTLTLAKSAPATIVADEDVTYTIAPSYTRPTSAGRGSTGFESITITDPLPAGSTFVSADNGGTYDAATHTVTWVLRPNPGSTVLTAANVTVGATIRFPSTTFSGGQNVTNVATATGKVLPTTGQPAPQVIANASVTRAVAAATYAAGFVKNASTTAVEPGMERFFQLRATNQSNLPVNIRFIDAMPCQLNSVYTQRLVPQLCANPGYVVTHFVASAFGGAAVLPIDGATIAYVLASGATGTYTVPAGDSEVTLAEMGLSTADPISSFEFTYGATVLPAASLALNVFGYTALDFPVGTSDAKMTNCADAAIVKNSVQVAMASAPFCRTLNVAPVKNTPRYEIFQGMTANGGVITTNKPFPLSVTLTDHYGRSPIQPTLTSLLPAGVRVAPGAVPTVTSGNADASLVELTTTTDSATGRQRVTLSWPQATDPAAPLGTVTAPDTKNRTVRLSLQLVADGSVPAGTITTVFGVTDPSVPTFTTRDCDNVVQGDQCQHNLVIPVAASGNAAAEIELNGDLTASGFVGETDYSAAGGTVDWRILLENTGNIGIRDFVAYSMLPRVDDTLDFPAVGTPRGSTFTPVFQGITSLPLGVELQYSAAANPCRPEILSDNPGCVNDWSSVAPADITTVKAIRVNTAPGVTLPPQTRLATDLRLSVPAGTPRDAQANGSVTFIATPVNIGVALSPTESTVRSLIVPETGLEVTSLLNGVAAPAETDAVFAAPGSDMNATFVVRNTGSLRLTDIVVTNTALAAADITCPATELEPGEKMVCTATIPAPAIGSVHTSTVTVTAQPVGAGSAATAVGPVLTRAAEAWAVTEAPAPSMTLTKTVQQVSDSNGNGITDAGDDVDYEFVISNTGNIAQLDLRLIDEMLAQEDIAIRCEPALTALVLAPGETATCATETPYTVRSVDVQAGQLLVNHASVTASTELAGINVLPAYATASLLVEQANPSIVLEKRIGSISDQNANGKVNLGDGILYEFTVTNNGNVPLQAPLVNDELLDDAGIAVTCAESTQPGTLAPGEAITCRAAAEYLVTADDVVATKVVNSASAAAIDPSGANVASATDTVTVQVAKPTADDDDFVTADDGFADASGNDTSKADAASAAASASAANGTASASAANGTASASAANGDAASTASGDAANTANGNASSSTANGNPRTKPLAHTGTSMSVAELAGMIGLLAMLMLAALWLLSRKRGAATR